MLPHLSNKSYQMQTDKSLDMGMIILMTTILFQNHL